MRTVRLLLAWLFVAVPLAWGVARSVRNALPLFRSAEPARPAHAAATPAPRDSTREPGPLSKP